LRTDSITVGERGIKPCRIFCIGKNYAEHIRELDDFDAKLQTKNEQHPVVFMKPVTSIVSLGKSIHVPTHGNILHHEVEVVVLLNGGGRNILINDALSYVAGVTLGLDITLRDVQIEVKKMCEGNKKQPDQKCESWIKEDQRDGKQNCDDRNE